MGEDEKDKFFDIVFDMYSILNINRKKKQLVQGFLIILESLECGGEFFGVFDFEESVFFLFFKIEELFVIEKIK